MVKAGRDDDAVPVERMTVCSPRVAERSMTKTMKTRRLGRSGLECRLSATAQWGCPRRMARPHPRPKLSRWSASRSSAHRPIRVNTVAPGPVWTPLIVQSYEGEKLEKFGGSPIGRPAQPAELAPAYVFLACDESRYVNGEVLGVTGGMLLA
jgi:hypothetical protein